MKNRIKLKILLPFSDSSTYICLFMLLRRQVTDKLLIGILFKKIVIWESWEER